jgi:hypothetical protein
MLTVAQQECVKKIERLGWIKHDRLASKAENGVALVYKTQGNVAILYPDGSLDRLQASQKTLKYRAGWYSPADHSAALRKQEEARRQVERWLERDPKGDSFLHDVVARILTGN